MSYARHLPVLMYHHVSDKPRQINLSPRTFWAQMKLLVESGWITGCRYFRCMQEFNLHAHLFPVTCLNSDGQVRILVGEPVYSHDECQMLVKQGRADEVMLCWPEGWYCSDYIHVANELGFTYQYTTESRMNNSVIGLQRIGRINTKERKNVAG